MSETRTKNVCFDNCSHIGYLLKRTFTCIYDVKFEICFQFSGDFRISQTAGFVFDLGL